MFRSPSFFNDDKIKMDRLLGTSKQKKFNIPVLDVLKQTPTYVTLFKDLCTPHHKGWTHIFLFLDAPLFDFMGTINGNDLIFWSNIGRWFLEVEYVGCLAKDIKLNACWEATQFCWIFWSFGLTCVSLRVHKYVHFRFGGTSVISSLDNTQIKNNNDNNNIDINRSEKNVFKLYIPCFETKFSYIKS